MFTCVMKVGKVSSALIIFSNISSLLRLLDGKQVDWLENGCTNERDGRVTDRGRVEYSKG